jgi:hypothetical protein
MVFCAFKDPKSAKIKAAAIGIFIIERYYFWLK